MAIETFRDPRTNKDIMIIKGEIEGLFFNGIKNPKTYQGANGAWTPDKSINLIVNGVKIWLGLSDKEEVNCKDVDGNYHRIDRGTEVSVELEENGEYEGETQYMSRASKITVLDASNTYQPRQANSGGGGGTNVVHNAPKRDFTGISVGHAINVAMNIIGDLSDPTIIVDTAKKAHDLTNSLKEEYGKKFPNMSPYDLGASVGQSVLSASHYVEDVEDIRDYAVQTLDKIVPKVTEYIKGGDSTVKKTVAKKAVKKAVKKAAKKAAKAKEVEPDISEFEEDSPF